jgi:hypothetical protein
MTASNDNLILKRFYSSAGEIVVEPVKAMWLSGDGKYLTAYNNTGAMSALNILPLKFLPAIPGTNSAE